MIEAVEIPSVMCPYCAATFRIDIPDNREVSQVLCCRECGRESRIGDSLYERLKGFRKTLLGFRRLPSGEKAKVYA